MEPNPPPNIIRNLILSSEHNQPIRFKRISREWVPFKWNLEDWANVLGITQLPCRTGNIKQNQHDPEWESETSVQLLSWESITNWNSDTKWIYFDYKNLKELLSHQHLNDFEWGRLGFPEINGGATTLWIGSKGSHTPCHFDTYGANLVAQLKGTKRWVLYPPESSSFLRPTRVPYEESSVYSQINFNNPSTPDLEILRRLESGLHVSLEEGDVLFVPPKWWHWVQSESFSISCNTWIPMPGDDESRLEEGILRSVIGSLLSISSPESTIQIINPNEEDLLELTEEEAEKILRTASAPLLNQTDVEESSPRKKIKLSTPLLSSLQDLAHEYEGMDLLSPFNASSFYKEIKAGSAESIPKKKPSFIVHLLNAIGNPVVLDGIRKQFLENASFSESTTSLKKM